MMMRVAENWLGVIRTAGVPIMRQLRLEEALFRAANGAWLLLNDGAPEPTVVMGRSGALDGLVNVDMAFRESVPIIRRFTGGGTVVADEGTIMASMVASATDGRKLFPNTLMEWSVSVFSRAFTNCPGFGLKGTDYTLGDRKVAGNAQSISKSRFVHHSSFLWDFKASRMAYLKHPQRQPDYRRQREHCDFLCSLADQNAFPARERFLDALERAAQAEGFEHIDRIDFNCAESLFLHRPHTQLTVSVPLPGDAFASSE